MQIGFFLVAQSKLEIQYSKLERPSTRHTSTCHHRSSHYYEPARAFDRSVGAGNNVGGSTCRQVMGPV